MINLAQKIEDAIHQVSTGAMIISSIKGNLDVVFKALTVNKNDYEQLVMYEIPDEHSHGFNVLASKEDLTALELFAEKYGVKSSESDVQAIGAAILLYFQSQFEMAQTIADMVYADRLRARIYPRILRDTRENAYREKLKETAKRPRNKHYYDAIKIAKATWAKYPAASKNGMCQKLHEHFKGQVSSDTLDRWIKAAKIKPRVKSKATSFSLVVLEGA
ncbi:hypothetical protein [Atlantibacter subterraneus]|uniref:hypothetical protein n=1 Tax=Atlantibacter subterraneus TaxID=255519 RepID=UPI002964EBCC|nr:hypothetical protein [Atlantibacter subterranea]MDW2742759.1 hypothetical protein [Atlantibacter subterranea]